MGFREKWENLKKSLRKLWIIYELTVNFCFFVDSD